MPEFIRVKDQVTKHEKSIVAGASLDGWEVLDKPAANPDGTPLPDKHYTAPESLSSKPNPSGQKADHRKES